MRQPGEPSIDEILDSIKKVIARDDRGAGGAARPPDGTTGTDRAPEADDDDVLDLAASPRFLLCADDPAPAEGIGGDDAALVTAQSQAAMRESLAALAMMAEPCTGPQALRLGETSVEGLARELLRPALAEWLDRHLPAIVERLVASEIARIVGKPS